jgi:uncharacterized protein involved in exopolysaccharide biosynthesis
MQRYLETFFRHRRPLIAPVVVALVISVGFVAVQPRTYQATAQIWFNSTTVAGDTSQVNAYLTPAQVGQGVFQELLQTRTFCVNVGERGPLAAYMQQGHMPASDPLSTALGALDQLRGKAAPDQRQLVEDAVQALLQKQVTVSVTGAQIVTVNFVYSNPYIATGTLKELVKEFSDQVLAAQQVKNQQQLNSLIKQVQDEQKQVDAADAALANYLNQHPALRGSTTGSSTPTDPTYAGLLQVSSQAHTQYADLVQKRDQAQLIQNQLARGSTSDFRVITPATLPDRPQSFSRTLISGLGAGLLVGLLVAVVALVALVLADQTLRTPGDVERTLGLKVVGVVPFLAGAGEPVRPGGRPAGRRRRRGRKPASPTPDPAA